MTGRLGPGRLIARLRFGLGVGGELAEGGFGGPSGLTVGLPAGVGETDGPPLGAGAIGAGGLNATPGRGEVGTPGPGGLTRGLERQPVSARRLTTARASAIDMP